MTTDRRRPATGNASRILVTGASIAAGLGLIGAMETSAGAAEAQANASDGPPTAQVVRRVVVVPTTQPDVVLHAAGSSGVQVVRQETPAPIIRVRPAATASNQGSAPAQTTSSGS